MKTILLPCLLVIGFISAFPQEKIIPKAVFEVVRKTSAEILKSRPFRVTVNTEITVNGKPQENSFSKTVVEVSGENRRVFHERKSNEKTSKNEYIQIGTTTYSRENQGQWKQTETTNRNETGIVPKMVDEQVEYKSLGTEVFNNQTANVYLKTSKFKRIDEANGNKEILTVESVKYWFGRDGGILKRETKRENRTGELVFNFHIISTFEYDQNIQIAVP